MDFPLFLILSLFCKNVEYFFKIISYGVESGSSIVITKKYLILIIIWLNKGDVILKKVVVAGGGVLGSQIAFQVAYKGFNVTLWLRSPESIERTRVKLERLYGIYLEEIENLRTLIDNPKGIHARGLVDKGIKITEEEILRLKDNAKKAFEGLKFENNMAEAVKDADLVIESMSEVPEAKIEFYKELAKHLPEKTIVTTNTSSLLPSSFSKYTGRAEKYLAMHFANSIWKNNIAEIMRTNDTNDESFNEVVKFAEEIGMIPLKVNKEQPGYLLNSLLIPFLQAGEALLANEVSDAETIDRAWMLGTGAPVGPFRILDIIGLETAYNVSKMHPEAENPGSTSYKISQMLKKYIDEGKTGINAGEGFYKYN